MLYNVNCWVILMPTKDLSQNLKDLQKSFDIIGHRMTKQADFKHLFLNLGNDPVSCMMYLNNMIRN